MKTMRLSKGDSQSLRMPSFFGNHMILQRDKPVRFFGWSDPQSSVSVIFNRSNVESKCAANGEWQIEFPALPAGGPYTLEVQSGSETLRFCDILMGDLWFCSGQSNMAFQVSRSLRAAHVTRSAELPSIRHFKVEQLPLREPALDVKGAWAVCDPATVGEFSAVGFYFAREIHQKIKVPIGILHSSWGGTPIEGWIPPEAYRNSPALRPMLRMEEKLKQPGPILKKMFDKWEAENVSLDPGNRGKEKGWARPDFDDGKWKTLKVPGFWEGQGLAIDGAVWFRRNIKIPKAWRGRELKLELGPIDDFDETYFNDNLIGTTGKSVENAHRVPRIYHVPAEIVKSGKVCLAVRIFDQFGSGGFTGQKGMLHLSCPELPDEKTIPLAGLWKYHVEWSVERPSPVPQPPTLPEPRAQLSRLYNGMIHAFTRLPIRGFLWYQGESNAYRAAGYRTLFPVLIDSWRKAWGDTELPFYFVQLSNFKTRPALPGDDSWAELREAQALALKSKNTGMAVAIDVGEEADIHPRNKNEVGRRLALIALSNEYRGTVEGQGPRLLAAEFGQGKIVLQFEKVGKGLLSKEKTLKGFAVSGKDRKWSWARAKISGKDKVTVMVPKGLKAVAVRYGWASNPEVSLENSHGLPAEPFRTDTWKLSTEGNLWPF